MLGSTRLPGGQGADVCSATEGFAPLPSRRQFVKTSAAAAAVIAATGLSRLARAQSTAAGGKKPDEKAAGNAAKPGGKTLLILGGTAFLGPEVVEALREVDVGVLDGRSDNEAWRVYETTLTRWRSGDLDAQFPAGEDGQQLADRLAGALTAIARRDRGPALVVGHGANLRAALPVLAGCADPGRDLGTGHAARLAVTVGRHPLVTVLDWP